MEICHGATCNFTLKVNTNVLHVFYGLGIMDLNMLDM